MSTETDNPDNPLKPAPARFPSPFTRYTHHGHRDAEARAANAEHQREWRALQKATATATATAARSTEDAS